MLALKGGNVTELVLRFKTNISPPRPLAEKSREEKSLKSRNAALEASDKSQYGETRRQRFPRMQSDRREPFSKQIEASPGPAVRAGTSVRTRTCLLRRLHLLVDFMYDGMAPRAVRPSKRL